MQRGRIVVGVEAHRPQRRTIRNFTRYSQGSTAPRSIASREPMCGGRAAADDRGHDHHAPPPHPAPRRPLRRARGGDRRPARRLPRRLGRLRRPGRRLRGGDRAHRGGDGGGARRRRRRPRRGSCRARRPWRSGSQRCPGVAGAEVARPGVVTAQLTAAADDDAVAEAALDAFAGTPGVTVGGPRRRRAADLRDRRRGPRPRRADRLPVPARPLPALLPRPRDAAAARRRRDDRARHVPRPHRGQPGLRAERLRAEPRHRARASGSRSTTRCSSSPATARSSPAAARRRRPSARRWPPPGAPSATPPPRSPAR